MHRRLEVRGLVQGVGFRPWVWQEATRLGLIGWVRNTSFGVEIDLHGEAPQLDTLQDLLWHAPAPARVEQVVAISAYGAEPAPGGRAAPFAIRPSITGAHTTALLGADLSICPQCLSELFDPTNRRWRHPFVHCPHCGPRYTVTRELPFDRAHTSLGQFDPCPMCSEEATHTDDRRFHDQTNTCPQCGPRLTLLSQLGEPIAGDPITEALRLIQSGQIIAIKGVGGFQLCCDARQADAVARLRARKQMGETKPMAVMAVNAASLEPWVQGGVHEHRWLAAPERPIVLLEQTAQARQDAAYLAPGLAWLGASLPDSALHYLLFHEAAGRPVGTAWLNRAQPLLLAMTSGNLSGAPVLTDNTQALRALTDVADAFLLHDRDIVTRNEDTVMRVRADGSPCMLRRGRGFAPLALPRPETSVPAAHSVLALGGQHNSTVCFAHDRHAQVAPPVGDTDTPATRQALHDLANRFPALLGAEPTALACDEHADFYSTRLAGHLASERQLPLIKVPHHLAHIAAVLGEHGLNRPVIGLALDGHEAAGQPLLRVDGHCSRTLGQLKPVIWPDEPQPVASVGKLLRLVAARLHLLGAPSYAGEAALQLESVARQASHVAAPLPNSWTITSDHLLDFQPLVDWLVSQTEPTPARAHSQQLSEWLAICHLTLAEGVAAWLSGACKQEGLDTVVLTGGCLINLLLDESLQRALNRAALIVHRPNLYPCGDGGLSLGQAWVARHQLHSLDTA